MIDPELEGLSISRQCELLSIPRSTYYYQRQEAESDENLALAAAIDRIWTASPAFGSRKITQMLYRLGGVLANRKRVRRLMKLMGIASLAPGPTTTKANPAHIKYPYLLRDVVVDHPNQAWATDITYIPYAKGFMYLVAIIDWHSRKVLSWRLSNTMGVDFCVSALTEALALYGAPEIFNSDQGSQFTSSQFTSILECHDVAISMDGRGRAIDNVLVERLWRTIKYEHIYLNPAASGTELREELARYIEFYNSERPHDGLGGKTPDEAYFRAQTDQARVA